MRFFDSLLERGYDMLEPVVDLESLQNAVKRIVPVANDAEPDAEGIEGIEGRNDVIEQLEHRRAFPIQKVRSYCFDFDGQLRRLSDRVEPVLREAVPEG